MTRDLDLTKVQTLEDCNFKIEEYLLKFETDDRIYVKTFQRVYLHGSFIHYLYNGMECATLDEVKNEIHKRS
nr:MAG TPA: hypothetical protein [Caudoviricetes sp.]